MPQKRKSPREWAAEFPYQELKTKRVKLAGGTETAKLRSVQDFHRCSMSEETLRMQMTLYFNQDLEGHFAHF